MDPVGRRKPQDNIPYRTVLVLVHKSDYKEKTTTSLKNNPCTPEKRKDSEEEKLQLKTIHQTNPSVKEQSLNNSTYDHFFSNTYPNSFMSFFSSYSIGLRYNTELPKKTCFENCL